MFHLTPVLGYLLVLRFPIFSFDQQPNTKIFCSKALAANRLFAEIDFLVIARVTKKLGVGYRV
jgi:hypothetical protein